MPAVTVAATPIATATKANALVDSSAILNQDKAARVAAIEALVPRLQNDGPSVLQSIGLIEPIITGLSDKKSAVNREAAASALQLLASSEAITYLEPFILADPSTGLIPVLLESFADKTPAVRSLAVDALLAIVKGASPWATAMLMPVLLNQIKTAGKWQIKTGCLTALNELVKVAPAQTASLTPEIIPILADAIWDTKADVKKAARDSLKQTTALVSNK